MLRQSIYTITPFYYKNSDACCFIYIGTSFEYFPFSFPIIYFCFKVWVLKYSLHHVSSINCLLYPYSDFFPHWFRKMTIFLPILKMEMALVLSVMTIRLKQHSGCCFEVLNVSSLILHEAEFWR